MQKQSKDRVVIASDVSHRDGIGIEIYRNDELVLEKISGSDLESRIRNLRNCKSSR